MGISTLAFLPLFQSTFPQGERHILYIHFQSPILVSIHVPTRGTTNCFPSLLVPSIVSIHVPTRGTTYGYRFRACICTVSIHVPTRGTTSYPLTPVPSQIGFNPRSHKGNDVEKNQNGKRFKVSIHVPTRGTTKGSA